MLDTARRIATPEGIEITLRVAGPVPRAIAYVIDLLVRGILMIGIMMGLSTLGRFGLAIFLLSAFLLEWLYPVLFEVLWKGATPGKRAMGLIVLNDDGTPIRWPGSLTRNLLRVVDFLPFMNVVGFCAMVINRDFKRLGDLAANSVVVYREQKPEPASIPHATPIAPGIALSLAEQRTILDFAERSGRITPERAAELAATLAPLTGTAEGPEAIQRVIGIANHLIGRK